MPLPPAIPPPPALAQNIAVSARVAQGGPMAGIRNTVFTSWMPAGRAAARLSGRVSLSSNGPGFSEALVQLGRTVDGRAACAARNATQSASIPPNDRLWAGILKNTTAGTVSIDVDVPLAGAWPPDAAQGACLLSLVSAGYPFLSGTAALYTTTDAELTLSTRPVYAGARSTLAVGLGGEFKFQVGSAPPLANYVGLRADRPLRLDGIAVSLSAAPVTGAPPRAGWGAPPQGGWRIGTSFVLVPAAACAAARYVQAGSHGDFTILRMPTPSTIQLPAGSRTVLAAGLDGSFAAPSQRSGYSAVRQTKLDVGDCLLAVEANVTVPATPPASLDVENQSTVYLSRPG